MIRTTLRIRILGIALIVAGLSTAGVGLLYGVPLADDGLDSAQAMYESQGIRLTYNQAGQLIDRGTPETAQAIMRLLTEDYAYPAKASSFDPDDPLVNTRDELMFQYATIIYHVLHAQHPVNLTAAHVPITYRGVTYDQPGVYNIEVGAYYGQLDRTHPIEGQLRSAWSPLALSLTSYLAAGHANQAAGELAFMTSLGFGGVGLLFAFAGGGLLWISFGPQAARKASQAHSGAHHAPAPGSPPNGGPRGR